MLTTTKGTRLSSLPVGEGRLPAETRCGVGGAVGSGQPDRVDVAVAGMIADARRRLDQIEALWPLVREHRRRRPGFFEWTKEDGDTRALVLSVASLRLLNGFEDQLHELTVEIARASTALEDQLPELAARVLRGKSSCVICRRPPVKKGLCAPCYSSWRAWTGRNPGGSYERWEQERAAKLAEYNEETV
jgi:hypothetical protein